MTEKLANVQLVRMFIGVINLSDTDVFTQIILTEFLGDLAGSQEGEWLLCMLLGPQPLCRA